MGSASAASARFPSGFRLTDTSLCHFGLRWLGPAPVIMALGYDGPAGLTAELLFVQAGMLVGHWLLKGAFELVVPARLGLDP